MSAQEPTKAAVSVAEMARMVGLSRARFYQLQKAGIFPQPERDEGTGRPFYTQELQKVCLEVRRRNSGVNGKKSLFYTARRPMVEPARPRPTKAKAKVPKADQHTELVEQLLDYLPDLTGTQVREAIQKVFPQGTAGKDEKEVFKEVYVYLKHPNSTGNVGR
jgi:hypothetical protein